MKIKFEAKIDLFKMYKPEWRTLPQGPVLFRAAADFESLLEPNNDNDTGKIGCYFSCGHPCLSDSMAIEYDRPLIRGQFILEDSVDTIVGKYGYQLLPKNQQNVNHYDDDIGALTLEVGGKFPYAEVFLTPEELGKLEIQEVVEITPEQIIEQYRDYITPNIDMILPYLKHHFQK